MFEIRIINIKQDSRYLEVEMNDSTTSAWLLSERESMNSFPNQNKKKTNLQQEEHN